MKSDPTPPLIEPLALRSVDAARAIGISLRAFQALLATGAIPSARVGGLRLVSVAALRAWLAAQTEKGAR